VCFSEMSLPFTANGMVTLADACLVILVSQIVSHEVLLHEELLDDDIVNSCNWPIILVQETAFCFCHSRWSKSCTAPATSAS
jgi:hypothetical protein